MLDVGGDLLAKEAVKVIAGVGGDGRVRAQPRTVMVTELTVVVVMAEMVAEVLLQLVLMVAAELVRRVVVAK